MYYNIRSGFVKDKTESRSFLPHLRCGCELESNHKNAIASKHFYLCYNIHSGFAKDKIRQNNGVRNDIMCVRNDDFLKNKNAKNIIFS